MPRTIPDIDLGHASGQLTVTGLLPDHFNPRGKRYQRVRVQCTCGHKFDIMAVRIRRGLATRCPRCVRDSMKEYRVGDRYDKLLVESFYYEHYGDDSYGRRMARCRCDCGNTTSVFVGLFKRNKTIDCGCSPLSTFTGVGRLSGAFFCRIKNNAKSRNLDVDVTKTYLWELFLKQGQRCALSGLPIELLIRKRGTASLDRIDSSKGYTKENVHWVHKDINKMKMEFPLRRFLELCHLVSGQHDDHTPSDHSTPERPAPRPRKRPGKKLSWTSTR